ncbi:MAG: hypothetical protein HC831_13090 [Chloroflexia bacterium]|nr:hypothetical protein [Chloroflexia bacterium]
MYETNIIPSQDNPWGYDFSAFDGITVQLEDQLEPSKTFDNSEYGVKMAFNLSGVDFSVLALSTFNKMPEFNMYMVDQTTIAVRPEIHPMKVYGLNFSKPVWDLVFRGDIAYYTDKAYAPSTNLLSGEMQKSNVWNYLLGLDYYPGSDWNISLQFNHTRIIDYSDAFGTNADTYLGTVNISKPIFRNTVTLSTFAYIDLDQGDFFDRTSIDVTAFESIHFLAGVDIFHGDKGVFGQYKRNSEIWIKAKYSF